LRATPAAISVPSRSAIESPTPSNNSANSNPIWAAGSGSMPLVAHQFP
jgi:hypothetical protein